MADKTNFFNNQSEATIARKVIKHAITKFCDHKTSDCLQLFQAVDGSWKIYFDCDEGKYQKIIKGWMANLNGPERQSVESHKNAIGGGLASDKVAAKKPAPAAAAACDDAKSVEGVGRQAINITNKLNPAVAVPPPPPLPIPAVEQRSESSSSAAAASGGGTSILGVAMR